MLSLSLLGRVEFRLQVKDPMERSTAEDSHPATSAIETAATGPVLNWATGIQTRAIPKSVLQHAHLGRRGKMSGLKMNGTKKWTMVG